MKRLIFNIFIILIGFAVIIYLHAIVGNRVGFPLPIHWLHLLVGIVVMVIGCFRIAKDSVI